MVSALLIEKDLSRLKSVSVKIGRLIALLVAILMGVSSLVCAQDFPEVTPKELMEMIKQKEDIVILDNQPQAGYDAGHIPGAVSFPWVKEIKSPVSFPHDKPLILYCACNAEEDALHMAAQLLEGYMYTNVKILKGGWIKWVELGYPVEKVKKK